MASTKVVYLLGTGATQAEARLVDDRVRLKMTDVKDGILSKISALKNAKYDDLKNELTGEYVDVEQLITLYESSSSSQHKKMAKLLRELFRAQILEQINKLDSGSGGRFMPKLCSALIDMHEIRALGENLCGIMTLNYDDIIERAAIAVKGSINYSLDLLNTSKSYIAVDRDGLLVLKLHGSFNWRNGFPLSVDDNIAHEEDVLWIPPGVEKHNEIYPFNIIWGRARELLYCDVLRIVGCSLSRNEWHLVSMLCATQKLNRAKREYQIEIISSPNRGNDIQQRYPHLRIKKIDEINEVKTAVSRELYLGTSKKTWHPISDKAITEYLSNNKNSFDIWLRAKGEQLVRRSISLDTSKNIFRAYMKE